MIYMTKNMTKNMIYLSLNNKSLKIIIN